MHVIILPALFATRFPVRLISCVATILAAGTTPEKVGLSLFAFDAKLVSVSVLVWTSVVFVFASRREVKVV